MRRITLGVEVGVYSIKMTWAKCVKGGAKVYASDYVCLQTPLLTEQSGMIVDFDKICTHITRFININRIKCKAIALSICSRTTVMRVCEVSNAPKREIYRAVNKNIGSYFKFNISDYVADFCVQPTGTGDKRAGTKIPLLLVAVQSDVVDSCMELCRRLALKPLYFDTQVSCLCRMLRYWIKKTDLLWMVIDVGESDATAVIVANGQPEMCRSFSINDIEQAVLLKNYYGRIHAQSTINHVLLTGARASDSEFQRMLELKMDAKVSCAEYEHNEISTVIGLILRERFTKELNLIPVGYMASRKASWINRITLLIGAILLPVAAAAVFLPPYLINSGNRQLQELLLETNDEKFYESAEVAADIISVMQELDEYAEIYDRLADDTFSLDVYNRLLELLPDGMRLTEVHMTSDGEYLLTGVAIDRATAAGFAEGIETMTDIRVNSVVIGLPTDDDAVRYEIHISVERYDIGQE